MMDRIRIFPLVYDANLSSIYLRRHQDFADLLNIMKKKQSYLETSPKANQSND
jgi:hypothetical protein